VIDALGNPQSVLVLGATSEIALATVARLARPKLDRVILAGRPGPGRSEAATQVKHLANTVTEIDFDAEDTGSHAELINSVFTAGDIDIVLLAFGVLGDQEEAERDPAAAVEVAQINYVGAVSIGLNVAQRLNVQGHGVLVVLSSVAGERARRSNFVYGSTKAGLDAFAIGLGDAMHGNGPRVLVVRPGFVRTKMTAHLPDAPLAVDADDVAERLVTAIRKGRETVYAPGAMRVVMSGLRHLPRPVFRRLPF
jgi:decaprenylphospho-beta-D-erythro-pentofuranosid-2-ulose 2-reductase